MCDSDFFASSASSLVNGVDERRSSKGAFGIVVASSAPAVGRGAFRLQIVQRLLHLEMAELGLDLIQPDHRVGELALGGVRALLDLDQLLGLAGQSLLAGAEDLLEVGAGLGGCLRDGELLGVTGLGVLERRDQTLLLGADPFQLLLGGHGGLACAAERLFGGLGLRGQFDAACELRLDLGAGGGQLGLERLALPRGTLQLGLERVAASLDLAELVLQRLDLGARPDELLVRLGHLLVARRLVVRHGLDLVAGRLELALQRRERGVRGVELALRHDRSRLHLARCVR